MRSRRPGRDHVAAGRDEVALVSGYQGQSVGQCCRGDQFVGRPDHKTTKRTKPQNGAKRRRHIIKTHQNGDVISCHRFPRFPDSRFPPFPGFRFRVSRFPSGRQSWLAGRRASRCRGPPLVRSSRYIRPCLRPSGAISWAGGAGAWAKVARRSHNR